MFLSKDWNVLNNISKHTRG